MRPRPRARLCAAALLATASSAVLIPAPAQAYCLPLMCKFSVSGKKGPYLDRMVTAEKLTKADASMTAGLADGRALNQSSLNQGSAMGTALRMPETERALTQMLDRLRAGWKHREPIKATIRIIGASQYAPLAKPDGVIVIPLGLLSRAQTDDEVAWVIAHEFSHIALAHFSREAQQRRLKAGVNTLVACSQLGFEVAQHRVANSGGQLQLARSEKQGVTAASAQVWAKSQIVGHLLESYNQHLGRKQEDQADVVGLDLVLRAGFSDEGFATALATVEADEKANGTILDQFGREMGKWTQNAAARSTLTAAKGGGVEEAGKSFLNSIISSASTLAVESLIKMATANHRPAKRRREGLSKYLGAAHKDANAPLPTTTWLTALRATAEFKDAETAVQRNALALQTLGNTPVDPKDPVQVGAAYERGRLALQQIMPALATRYGKTPLIANTIAQIEASVENHAAADKWYDVANRSPEPAAAPAPAKGRKGRGKAPKVAAAPPPPPMPPDPYLQQSVEGFREHAKLLVKMRNFNKALSVIELAKSRGHDDSPFLPALVRIYAETKKMPQLYDALQRCIAMQDEKLGFACNVALMGDQYDQMAEQLPPAEFSKAMSIVAEASSKARSASTCGIVRSMAAQKPKAEDDTVDD
jgi:Zn-dependent protease with chaperone function